MRGNIGNVERGELLDGCIDIIVGRSTHQGKSGEVNDSIHDRLAVLDEITFYGWTSVQSAGEGGDDFQTLRLQHFNHAVIMAGILTQQIGPQHQNTDRPDGVFDGRKFLFIFEKTLFHIGMVDADFGISAGQLGGHMALQCLACTAGIAVNQATHHIDNIVIGSGQPILQGQKILPYVLRRARNEP